MPVIRPGSTNREIMSFPSLSLLQEEQEELACSDKKVKDVKHAGFREEMGSGPSSPTHG